jgi:cell division protein FtsI/penicillin-binding protein 2
VDKEGRTHYKYQGWTDSWFIGFAPADNPKIAFAVVVENGGEGSRTAAPIAAKIVERAAQAGFFRQLRSGRSGD